MNKVMCLCILNLLITVSAFSQLISHGETLRYKNSSSSGTGNTLLLGSVLVISPVVIIEDGKTSFGLSKELSAGRFPYGRAELDYSYIFRSGRTSLINVSYNYDIPLNGSFSSPSLFMVSPGAGYYTDFTRNGFFAQLAVGLFASTGLSDAISIHPCIKFRKIFMRDSNPGAFSISIGVGFGFYGR